MRRLGLGLRLGFSGKEGSAESVGKPKASIQRGSSLTVASPRRRVNVLRLDRFDELDRLGCDGLDRVDELDRPGRAGSAIQSSVALRSSVAGSSDQMRWLSA